MLYVLSYGCYLILWLMGWTPLKKIKAIQHDRYVVCVFSHTSYLDFMMMVLYYFAYHKELKYLKCLIRGDFFSTWYGPLLRYVGGIPGTLIREKHGGAVKRIVDEIYQQPRAYFLICPKGTIMQGEWRSGYYYIAQQLQANLIALGMDYEAKKVTIGQMISYKLEEERIKSLLYNDLGNIVPLYPEREMMRIRPHDSKKVSVMSKWRLISIAGIAWIAYRWIAMNW